MNRIPFTLPDVGFREIKGLVYIESGFLVISFENALFGVADVEKERIQIEPAALHALSVKHGLVRDKLIVKPKKVDLLDIVPGGHASDLRLRIWMKYRSDLQQLVREFYSLPEK